jgi:hypothetical protein
MSTAEVLRIEPKVTRARSSAPFGSSLQSQIDAYPLRAFAALSCFYVVAVVGLSHFKLLWLDELITLHIAQLSGPSAIWNALAHGADPNPPVTHILVHYCRAIFGERELALRLPAILGYWVGLLSLFLYLLRRLPATWALAGTTMSMCMASFEYSYESRSYGIFYGLAMLAFYFWSRTVDGERTLAQQRFALFGMTLALALGISTNYFAVLAFLPIAAGEIAKTIFKMRYANIELEGDVRLLVRAMSAFDLRIWAALVIAALPLVFYRSLIAHSIAQFAPYAFNKVSLDQVFDSYTEMVEVMLYPTLALFLLAILARLSVLPFKRVCKECRAEIRPRWLSTWINRRSWSLAVPTYEAIGILFLMAYPILGYIVASIHGGMLSPRFVIPVCLGFAIAGVLICFQLFGQCARSGLVALVIFLVWFMCRESVVGYWYAEQKQSFYKIFAHLPEAEQSVPPGSPIVIPDPLLALTFQHYAPAEVAKRVAFPVDFPAIRTYRHDDSPEENLWAGRKSIYPLRIMPVATFEQNVGPYLIIASDGNWLLQDLSDHLYTYTRLPINTRAGAIGGFTPLARGVPSFYWTSGDRSRYFAYYQKTKPFHIQRELPDAKSSVSN